MPKRFIVSRAVVLVVAGLLAFAVVDWQRPPERQLSAAVLVSAIDAYQATLGPRMPGLGVRCRFEPTCSHYGEESIRRHGAPRGLLRTLIRIARCGPWTPAGTVDPP